MSEKITKKNLTETQRKARVQEMKEKFKKMENKEAAIEYLKTLYINQIDKATMVGFVSAWGTDEEKDWFKTSFKSAASKTVEKRKKNTELEQPIIRTNRKGYTKEQTYTLDKIEGTEQKVYSRKLAAVIFAEKFNFEYRKTSTYDEFDELD